MVAFCPSAYWFYIYCTNTDNALGLTYDSFMTKHYSNPSFNLIQILTGQIGLRHTFEKKKAT